ncbi:permease for cytosine/purines, uracil, thiamine, allantoin-domain-containing protein [Epithele typhae]|uniref:permease for cytosine/purines, uracil, thiamine, allantoin-domain-containing protein n=1 Tax=Epithele typhae TaxID=378194 RepID=UPI0020072924|nr:permease for cytosine/purines, uracil, thiamine, allantoin-domain-containing protein [Epithele typhae]KAH9911140.1 permease for cytosine/purines, uracil, thiamine, allantoin-domain-containing protein [Epithele typhae]
MPSLKPVREWAHRLSRALRSRDAFCAYVRTHGNARRAHSWTNEDLAPSPPPTVNWRAHNFCLFWFGMGFGNWTLGSSIVGAGLSWWQATIVVWIAASVSGLAMAFNSRAAANYHSVPTFHADFPDFQGGAYVSTMLRCLFGHRWETIGPRFPPSVGTTLQRFIGFLLFWLIEFPFCSFRPNRLRWLYTLKAITLPPSVFGLLVYCLVQSRARLASDERLIDQDTRPTGPALAWLIVGSITSAMGKWSTFIANMPDFARYATDPSGTMWTHILFVPFPAALGGMVGIFGTSCLQRARDVYDAILDHSWTGPARFGVFLLAFSSALFNFGRFCDATALFPSYVNLTRGMWFCCLVSLALVPWKILASAQGFLAFLNGYGIFMGPTAAIMITDYWIVRRGNVHIADAYSSTPGARYMYVHGLNLNATAAYACGVMIPFVGFVGTFGVPVPLGAARCDELGWYISAAGAGSVYLALCRIFPLKNVDRSLAWEQLAREFAAERTSVENEPEKASDTGPNDGVVLC